MIAALLTFASFFQNLRSCHAASQLRSLKADGGDLTDDDKTSLLDKHNEYRSITALGNTGSQPAATNMIKLIWDDDLALDSKAHAAKCENSHGTGDFGENLFAAASTQDNVDNIDKLISGVTNWYDEQSDYTYASNSCGATCGHYTQVVWADTAKVGCGYAECDSIFPSSFPFQVYLVCRYTGPGNYIGVKPYETDSSCPTDYTLDSSTSLCVDDNEVDGGDGGDGGDSGDGGDGGDSNDCKGLLNKISRIIN